MRVVYATATAQVGLVDGGPPFLVRKGSHWPADDPIVQQHPSLFSTDARYGLEYSTEPAGYRETRPVEQATRAPGEQRHTRRAP